MVATLRRRMFVGPGYWHVGARAGIGNGLSGGTFLCHTAKHRQRIASAHKAGEWKRKSEDDGLTMIKMADVAMSVARDKSNSCGVLRGIPVFRPARTAVPTAYLRSKSALRVTVRET